MKIEMASELVVVMVPFVAQGHLNQLLHLSRLISAHNIPIHFVCTASHNRQARLRLHGWNPEQFIQFHDLPDPILPSHPVPNPTSHFPTHLQPSFESSLLLRQPVADLIRSISQTSQKLVVVHDALMSYVVQDTVSIPNAESYIFRPLSVLYYFCINWEKLGRRLPFEPDDIRRLLPSPDESISQEFVEFIKLQFPHQNYQLGNLFDSSRIIEGEFLEPLEKEGIYGKNHWAVGPFNPVEIRSGVDSDLRNRHNCLHWLDKQRAGSVIYVSFGTTTTWADEQITELALGLERSQQRFLWVLRDADKGSGSGKEDGGVGANAPTPSDSQGTRLPKGFEERVAGRGLVVKEWAPQVEILGHVSTGGFVSHCGWNSSMEALTAGVAVAAWPIHTDQPYNAFLLSKVLGVAVVMKEWLRRDELVTSVMVEKVVRELMDTEEGAAIRKRAAEVGDELRRSMADGGVSNKELNSFISYIRR